jgi:hypothetical protein
MNSDETRQTGLIAGMDKEITMDAGSEAKLQNVFPPLADCVRRMATMLEQEGIVIRVVQGLRSWAEQDALYAQGRTAPGNIVTNCRGGQSYHNFGLAVDCAPSKKGPGQPFDPDWNEQNPAWQRLIAVGQSVGLDSGATWRTFKDMPHFQRTGRFPEGAPNDEIHQLFNNGGTNAVWDAVSQSLALTGK